MVDGEEITKWNYSYFACGASLAVFVCALVSVDGYFLASTVESLNAVGNMFIDLDIQVSVVRALFLLFPLEVPRYVIQWPLYTHNYHAYLFNPLNTLGPLDASENVRIGNSPGRVLISSYLIYVNRIQRGFWMQSWMMEYVQYTFFLVFHTVCKTKGRTGGLGIPDLVALEVEACSSPLTPAGLNISTFNPL